MDKNGENKLLVQSLFALTVLTPLEHSIIMNHLYTTNPRTLEQIAFQKDMPLWLVESSLKSALAKFKATVTTHNLEWVK